MNIVDSIIIIFLLVCILGGMRRGFIKEVILLVGLIVIFVISWVFRVPISTFLYTNLPFFRLAGFFKGISILNILLYELIAFLVIFSVLSIIFVVVLKISGLIEKILKVTIILGIFSKIGGAILGFIEGYLIVFLLVFVFSQPFVKVTGLEDSKLSKFILEKTPIASSVTYKTRKTVEEVYGVAKKYKKDMNNPEVNKEMIDIFLKYDIITEENLTLLRKKGKID